MRQYLLIFILSSFAYVTYGQKTTSTATVNTSVNIKSSNQTGQILRLYPNPADKYVNIYIEWPQPQSFRISIYDYNFDAWIKEIPVDVRKSYQYSLDVSQLQNGKYKILVKSSSGQYEEELKVAH